MAKKNKKEREPVYRTLNELSDSEVIKYAEWMSYPLYLDQFNNSPLSSVDTDTHLTNCDIEQVANARLMQLQNGFYHLKSQQNVIQEPQTTANDTQTKGKGTKVYVKKRGFFVFVITLLMIAMLAVAVIGTLNLEGVSKYVTIHNSEEESVGLVDPVIGLINSLLGDEIYPSAYQDVIDNAAGVDDIKALLPVYATCAAALLIALCLIIGFIKALVALFSGKKKDGYYKKFKFGFLSLVIFIGTILFAVSFVCANSGALSDLVSLVKFKGELPAFGYGLYALLGGSLITFICSCCSYKKAKK